jgi:hypothetical protein
MFLGHKSLNTTAIYLHLTQKRLSALQSPFDLLRLPKDDEGLTTSPATSPATSPTPQG